MFFHLLYIHLFRPFLKYNPSTSPLPSHVSPRKLCTQAAGSVSKLMRLYKRTYGLRQICNIAVYIVHSACTIHLLNLPEKTAKRDIIHGVKHLEEIAEDWLCARRTLSILSVLARKWKIDLPEEAATVVARTDAKYGYFSTADVPSPKQELAVATPPSVTTSPARVTQQQPLPQTQNGVRSHNQLQQSLYSYLPDSSSMPLNMVNVGPIPALTQNTLQTSQAPKREALSAGIGSTNIPNETLVPSIPYPRYPYNPSSSSLGRANMTPSNDLPRTNSGVTSEASGGGTRQVSPNTLFGGVEALVESQDWWLRDQASLVVGFDNWMSAGNGDMTAPNSGLNGNGNGNANKTSPELDPMAGIGAGFYMPTNMNRDAFGDDDWNYS
jgi:hypothetical protein